MSNEYTPTTGQVRVAYVRAIRNAFVGSTSEHEEEFDRWRNKDRAEAQVGVLRETAYYLSAVSHAGRSVTVGILIDLADRIARVAGIETGEEAEQ